MEIDRKQIIHIVNKFEMRRGYLTIQDSNTKITNSLYK